MEKAIVEFNEFESQLQEFKGKYDDVVYDLTDATQEKQARSDKLSIGKAISALDKKHKELKAPLKEQVDLIDGERKRIKDDLLGVQGKIKIQIENHEKKIEEHDAMLRGKVDTIEALAELGEFETPTSEQLSARIKEIEAIDVDDSYEHMKAAGTLAQVDGLKKLKALLASRIKFEQEQAELEKLRKEAVEREQKEREEQIRKEAEAEANTKAQEKIEEAQRKEQEAKDAAEKQKREAEAAKMKAEKDAEVARVKAKKEAEEAKKQAAIAERERIEKEQREAEAKAEAENKKLEAKKANQKHRAKIHASIKDGFLAGGFNEDDAVKIVNLIKDGAIKHVSIDY